LARLVREARRAHASFVFVLDDAHLIDRAVLPDLVMNALHELPAGSLIALASRTEPALPLGRLRARRLLVELRAEQLAMSPGEAALLLRECGFEPEVADVQTLVSRTEGWPAALYLAALALRETPESLHDFGGQNHLVTEFVRDEVLNALPDELLAFARRTSVLGELSGAVCDAVLVKRGSASALRALAELSPSLSPVDPAHHCYRWQRLVREALNDEFELTEPELAAKLRLRASRWYARHGDVGRAIEHAAAAGDEALTGDLLWENTLDLVTCGRGHVVRGALGRFTPQQVERQPALALAGAVAAALAGDAEQAHHLSTAAASALEKGEWAGKHGSLRVGLAVVDALDAPEGVERMAETAARAAKGEPATSPWRALCQLVAGIGLHLRGERDGAEVVLDRAARLSGSATPALTCLGLAQRAMIAIERQDWEVAAEVTDRAAMMIEEWGLKDDPLSALTFAAAAATRAHAGRIDEAKHDLRRGVDLLAAMGEGVPWYGAEARILLAHASLWLADVVGARTLLAEASRAARKTPDATIFAEWFERAWAKMDTLAETSMSGPSSLTIAELRILRFLPSHRSFREIAEQLGVSANTVKTQAHAIYRKLGAASRSEAVTQALQAGLLGQ
jgi:LuxR family maltose regulon positive regulatory protein